MLYLLFSCIADGLIVGDRTIPKNRRVWNCAGTVVFFINTVKELYVKRSRFLSR